MSEKPPPSTLAQRIAKAPAKILQKGDKKLIKKLGLRTTSATPIAQSSSQPLHEVIPVPVLFTPVTLVEMHSPGMAETETLVTGLDKIIGVEHVEQIDRGNSCEAERDHVGDELREELQVPVVAESGVSLNVAETVIEKFKEDDRVGRAREKSVPGSPDVRGLESAEAPENLVQEPVACPNSTEVDDADIDWTDSEEEGKKEAMLKETELRDTPKMVEEPKRKSSFGEEDEKLAGEEEEEEVVFLKKNIVEPEKRRRLVKGGKPVLKTRLVDEDCDESGSVDKDEPVARRVGTRSVLKQQLEKVGKLERTVTNVREREARKKEEEKRAEKNQEESDDDAGSYDEPSDSDTNSEAETRRRRRRRRRRGSEDEIDRVAFFSKHQVLHGSILHDVKEFHLKPLLRMIGHQGWLGLFSNKDRKLYAEEVREFYTNCKVNARRVFTTVKGVEIEFGRTELGIILNVHAEGYCRYIKLKWPKRTDGVTPLAVVKKFSGKPKLRKERKVDKKEMEPAHQLLFEFVHRFVLPRGERNCEASGLDLTYMDLLDRGVKINLPGLIIRHIKRIADTEQKPHSLVHSYIIQQVLEHFGVPLEAGKKPTIHEMFGINVLKNCDFFRESRASKRPMQAKQEQEEESEDYGPEEAIDAVKELETHVLEVNEENTELHRQLKLKDQEFDRLKIACHKYEAELLMERAKNTKQLEALLKHFNVQL